VVPLKARASIRAAWPKACHGGSFCFSFSEDGVLQSRRREMPKLKTKSGAKKRFKLTATGKIKAGVAGKRHRLIHHSAKYIRQNRGTKVMSASDTRIIKTYIPNGLP
jgi:large subunit ribosomal protein L35